LKDAAAAAILRSPSSNGVVIITKQKEVEKEVNCKSNCKRRIVQPLIYINLMDAFQQLAGIKRVKHFQNAGKSLLLDPDATYGNPEDSNLQSQ